MEIATLGIDLSKTTFYVIRLNARGESVVRRKFSRKQLLLYTANRQQLLIGMEACGGAHYLARALREQGHDVKLMPAQYVKPYVKTNKNDYLDAEAIAEAVQRPTMRFVPIKTDEQLDLQALHRVRDRWVARRTAVMNQMRGFLLERGVTMRRGPSHLAAQLQIIFNEDSCSFSARLRGLLLELKHEWDELEKRIEEASAELQHIARQDDACHRLWTSPVLDHSFRQHWSHQWAMRAPSEKVEISRHGWVWCHDSIPLVAEQNCSASVSEAMSICDACCSTARDML